MDNNPGAKPPIDWEVPKDLAIDNQSDLTAFEQEKAKDSVKKEKKTKQNLPPLRKKVISVEPFVAMGVILAIFIPIGAVMGFDNMLNTIFNNAFTLLIDVCFYLLAIAVVIGALSSVLSEFGIISLFNKILSPLMKPIYGMPGATSIAVLSTFLSDNPAVLTLSDDRRYRAYFKKYQLAALTNLGTAFGMGLIVIVTMLTCNVSKGSVGLAVGVGALSAVIGSILATRLMLTKTKRVFGTTEEAEPSMVEKDTVKFREIREGNIGQRLISSLLEGGESGVKIGLSIIPGVLIIANLVFLLSDGKEITVNGQKIEEYCGYARQGVALLPFIGEKLSIVFKVLFGFSDPAAISVPLTALGSAGAAIGVVSAGNFTANELAVFTAMCMFWSGYLSTHVAMMDRMGFRKLTGWSILFHTISGVFAGVIANYLYKLLSLLL